jgi:hypothetical protein
VKPVLIILAGTAGAGNNCLGNHAASSLPIASGCQPHTG